MFLSANRAKCRKQTCRPGPGLTANQIILFTFVRAIYDEFNAYFNGTGDNCTSVPALYHNYSDIGTIEVDAYINTRRAQVDAIQNYQQRRNSAFDVVPAASNGNYSALVASGSSP